MRPAGQESAKERLGLLLCLFLLAVGAAPGGAEPLALAVADPHLPTVALSAGQAARAAKALAAPADFTVAEPFEGLPGGAATLTATTLPRDMFSLPSANMKAPRTLDFELGKALFDKLWVAAPASTRASDGLGPLYNARACQDCHFRDGRGRLPGAEGGRVPGLVLRFALPDAAYGAQLQDHAVPGLSAEGRVITLYNETSVTLADGLVVSLRAPLYMVGDPVGDTVQARPGLSPRLAPPMIGLGLLEAIPSGDILAGADDEDRDGDGISGRAMMVWSEEFGRPMLGRFGLKAGVATIREQVARALSADMGLSSPLRPAAWGDCTLSQTACRTAPDGEEPEMRDGREVDGESLDLLTFYARNLAVPARRDPGDPAVLRGKAVFYQSGCAACHRPKHVTGLLDGRPEQSFQLIWPYTDLLLHDMGTELADGAGDSGREWRTPPLWGHGLAEAVSGQGAFLHDGRARSILEAVMWHGGEGAASREPRPRRHAARCGSQRFDFISGKPVSMKMNRLSPRWTILASLAALALAPTARADVAEAVRDHIQPGYAAFRDRTAALAAEPSCDPAALRPAFNAAFDAWMAVGHLHLGPAEEEGRALAIAFWPDPKGMGLKAQKRLLAGDPADLAPDRFAEQSVAARGLFALERLLYPAAPPAGDTCPLIRATVADLARMAAEIDAGWTGGYADRLLTPGAEGNDSYLTVTEARQALFTQLATGLEFMADQRLGRPLGTFDRPRPERAEARPSGRSQRNIALSLAALRDLAVRLEPQCPLTQAAFDHALTLADALDDPTLEGVDDPKKRLKVEILQQAVRSVRDAAIAEIAPALGVDLGFNSQDGD